MNKQTRTWVKATRAWIKTQQHSIDSCDLAIRHHNEQIDHLRKAIALETAERNLKVIQLKEVQANLEKVV